MLCSNFTALALLSFTTNTANFKLCIEKRFWKENNFWYNLVQEPFQATIKPYDWYICHIFQFRIYVFTFQQTLKASFDRHWINFFYNFPELDGKVITDLLSGQFAAMILTSSLTLSGSRLVPPDSTALYWPGAGIRGTDALSVFRRPASVSERLNPSLLRLIINVPEHKMFHCRYLYAGQGVLIKEDTLGAVMYK